MAKAKKAAADETTAAPADAGDNRPTELTAEERKSLHFHHYRRIAAKKDELDAIREEYKTLRKEAKADGLILADVDFMLKCAEIQDDSIVTDELRRRTEIAAWFALPVQYQADLFTGFSDAHDRIEKEGEAAGLAGRNVDSHDYAKGSTEAEVYERGWDRGQKTMRDDLQAALEKNNARKAKQDEAKLIKAADMQADEEEAVETDPFDEEEDTNDLRPRFKRGQDADEAVH
ncbi:hypothetical protein [Microbaculum marinum]|uniref:Uncharacterized protein n=1 Tax=Microbaculum marinum TaxID=1764581 RepID=A0AAW9RCI4_9HYPH